MNTSHDSFNEMHSMVVDVLVAQGWTASAGPALATKMFDTAVGTKQAIAWFTISSSPKEWQATLSGEYWSEGNNVLSASGVLIPYTAPPEQIVATAKRYCENVDRDVSNSYARRLLLKFGYRAA